jgi:[acyl-carrier-protein] S-malonyltransferase
MAITLMFSGQGAQKVGMGKSLYEESPVAKSLYDEANKILGWDLAKISFEGPPEQLVETKVCQPALFVHGFALFSILKEEDRTADVTIATGLSLGEITALTAAGVFDFKTGLEVVAERGRLMQEACEKTRGGMASVIGVDRETVQAFSDEMGVQMANLNCPGQIVISGEKDKIHTAVQEGQARGFRRVIELEVAGAYHSRLMEPAREAFADYLSKVEFSKPEMTVLTNTTGKAIEDPDAIREALIRQIVSPVLWEDCLYSAAELNKDNIFWELGPGGILSGLVRRTNKEWTCQKFSQIFELVS